MINKPLDFVIHCENVLGTSYPTNQPLWQGRALEAKKLKAKMVKNPQLYTWENLTLAVEYLRRRRQAVASPVVACWYVKPALGEAPTPEPARPLGDLIDEALADEQMQRLHGWQQWVSRLVRAQGDVRQEVYDEWRTERWEVLREPPARLCGNCTHALLGQLVHCTLFNFGVLDERASAGDCRAFEVTTGRWLQHG